MREIISELEQLISEFPGKFSEISTNEFSLKSTPDKWSKKEVLGHLIDSAHNNLRRFITGQYAENQNIVYDQNFWVAANNYQYESKENIIQLWVLMNKRICAVLENMPAEKYNNTVDTDKQSVASQTLQWLAQDYVKHLKHHINQVIPNSFDIFYTS